MGSAGMAHELMQHPMSQDDASPPTCACMLVGMMHLHQHPDQHPDEHPEQGAWRTCSIQPLVWAYMGIVLDGLLQGLARPVHGLFMAC